MSRQFRRLVATLGFLALVFTASIIPVVPVGAAESPGPGGTYECWDRCRYGVGCNTSCYDDGVQISCNEYHHTCGGVGGTVGQGCGDGICWFDAYLGYENDGNCPTDC